MKRILFVCVENSCRSQMAEGFARGLGRGSIETHSAGSRPSGVLNPKAVRSMAEAGIDLASYRSKGIDEVPAGAWDYVLTMGCGNACPSVQARHHEDWAIPDPKNMEPDEFARVRDQIRECVKALIERCRKA